MTTSSEGNVVQLKSGGTKMTIDAIRDQTGQLRAMCAWLNGAIRMSDLFEFHSLRNLEDGTPVDDCAPVARCQAP